MSEKGYLETECLGCPFFLEIYNFFFNGICMYTKQAVKRRVTLNNKSDAEKYSLCSADLDVQELRKSLF